ncbi:MAG TPA: response regulator transcription factor [Planctomycetota bacterium]|nr:response regulator transcription factor [Planctomycetota bacterium]
MRVLVVEDATPLAALVRQGLEENGFSVDVAPDGESGLYSARNFDYDAVVLDLMLPRLDGWTVLRKLRAVKKTPVLILTARDALADKLKGLDDGADDYLTKPFEVKELAARVRALIRRAADKPDPVIRLGEIEIDTSARAVRKGGRPVELTAKEFAVVELLALHRGELVTRTMIYDHIYDDDGDTLSNVVDVFVARIRKKLGKDIVETCKGQGYRVHV